MICPNCGADNEESALVCAQCEQELPKQKANLGRDFAWASLALGIWSMLFYPYLYAPLALIAAVLARRHQYQGKMPLVGVILGLVALLGWAVFQLI